MAAVLWGSQALVGRRRPYLERRCDLPEFEGNTLCSGIDANDRRSFIAGHPAVAFTAAALTCTHRGYTSLYGHAGDTLACGVSIGAASVGAVSRVLSERHYPTDTLLGSALGAFSGWFFPTALHYGFDSDPIARGVHDDHSGSGSVYWTLIPVVGERPGAAILGRF